MAAVLGKCAVCAFSCAPDKISALPCGHTFHYECILQWVKNWHKCPTCKAKTNQKSIIKNLCLNFDINSKLDSIRSEMATKKREFKESKRELNEKKDSTQSETELASMKKKMRDRARECKKMKKKMMKEKRRLMPDDLPPSAPQNPQPGTVPSIPFSYSSPNGYHVQIGGNSAPSSNQPLVGGGPIINIYYGCKPGNM